MVNNGVQIYNIRSEGGTSEDLSPDPHLKFSSGIHFLGENGKKSKKLQMHQGNYELTLEKIL